ncbi:MAG TPA: hypothetical protein VK539_16405 [Myxococcaceae bacterium]|nr:hypothetical protein [Myxococcaceae bacterium]
MFSREAAQAFALVTMALLTHTAKGFGEQVAKLPGSAQVSMQAAGRDSLLLSEVIAVESVAVTAEGFSVVLPPLAMAIAADGGRGPACRSTTSRPSRTASRRCAVAHGHSALRNSSPRRGCG